MLNEKIWNETVAHFTSDTIDVEMAAKARTARTIAAATTNAHFTFPQLGMNFQYGETAAYQFVYGKWNLDAEDVKNRILTPKKYIEYFFGMHTYIFLVSLSLNALWNVNQLTVIFPFVENERLPTELGWTKPVNRLIMDTLQAFTISMMELTQVQMNGAA